MAKMYYEKDCDINYLNGKKIAIIGYGSQGHAHALNLKDSGCDVCVGLREGSKNWKNAEEAGLKVMTIAEAAKWGDIVMMLINDEVQADVYKRDIEPNLVEGNALAFAHGFNIRYQQIVPPKGVDVFMAAPKGPGHTVRSTYVNGKGVPCLVAVEQGRVIAAAKSGKVKTASTMVCICLMLLLSNAATLRLVCVWIILLTTIYSGVEYFIKNRDVLANGEM